MASLRKGSNSLTLDSGEFTASNSTHYETPVSSPHSGTPQSGFQSPLTMSSDETDAIARLPGDGDADQECDEDIPLDDGSMTVSIVGNEAPDTITDSISSHLRQRSVATSPCTIPDIVPGPSRAGRPPIQRTTSDFENQSFGYAQSLDYEVLQKPENEVEAQRMANNFVFGFRKWKSHVTRRPLAERSDVVRKLYTESIEAERGVPSCRPGRVVYVVLFGWWVALLYLLVAGLMVITVVGFKYSRFCLKLSGYFLWPFGKFVYRDIPSSHSLCELDGSDTHDEGSPVALSFHNIRRYNSNNSAEGMDTEPLLRRRDKWGHRETRYWKRPATYIWLLLGLPILSLTHMAAFLISWLPVVTIPIAKIHLRSMEKLLLLPPELLRIDNNSLNRDQAPTEIIMYACDVANVYYYKYTVDGMNVICVNMLALVVVAILAGYLDEEHHIFPQLVVFILSLISIIPLAYYIGMGISSLSAQTNFAVGAVLNASFGSTVEIILYLTALYKGKADHEGQCYQDLVKAALVGSLLATTLLIPGLSMIVGGIKHSAQRFNPTSAGVTATLLFVSVAGVFAPSIFSRAYALFQCDNCKAYNGTGNGSYGIECDQCRSDMFGPGKNVEIYRDHVLPLIYTCMLLLPLAYVVGLVYSLKTHRATVYDAFITEMGPNPDSGHGVAHWGRVKSLLILLVSIVLMSLCADLVTFNIKPLLGGTVSVFFVGVTLLALVPDIPEIIIGIQFALQNNISLSIEVGSCIAVQICLLQIPILLLADLIKPTGFYLLFSDVHIYSVIIGVLLNNYVFQDGKSNYFQGFALVLTYMVLVAMYFFAPNPPGSHC